MGAFQAVLTNSIDKAVVAVDNCLEVYTLQEVTIKEFRHVVNDTHDASTAMTQIEVDVGIVAQDGFLVFDILEHRISSNAMVAQRYNKERGYEQNLSVFIVKLCYIRVKELTIGLHLFVEGQWVGTGTARQSI